MFERLFLLYVVGCAAILFLRYRRDWREWVARLAFAACLPAIGLILPLFWTKRWHERNDRYGRDLEPEIFNYESDALAAQAGLFLKPQAEKEINIVPLEEALYVNDRSSRRKVMIDLLKRDSLEYLEVLRIAVANEDTETSHYAVSAIVEVKRKLTLSLQELAVKYEEEKNDPYFLQSYATVLKSYMRSGFIDERTLLMYKHTYTNVLEQLLEADPKAADAYEEKIEADLELREFERAEKFARLYLEQYPEREGPYLALMKVYYAMRAYEQLQQTLARLKASTIRLTSHALKIVRFWTEAHRNEKEDDPAITS